MDRGRDSQYGAGLWRCSRFDRPLSMTPKIWNDWQTSWRWMEALAAKRGWEVTPLKIDPPSSEAQIVALELKHGLKVPAQLREILTGYSARVQFGWSIPSHVWPPAQREDRNVGRSAKYGLGYCAYRRLCD
jgi:hypothetical protein